MHATFSMLALAVGTVFAQPAGNYAPPGPSFMDGTVLLPYYSGQQKQGGFFTNASFVQFRETNPIDNNGASPAQNPDDLLKKLARIKAKRAELDKVEAETMALLKKAVERLDAVIAAKKNELDQAIKTRGELNRAIKLGAVIEGNGTNPPPRPVIPEPTPPVTAPPPTADR